MKKQKFSARQQTVQCVLVWLISPLSLVLIMRLTPGLMFEEEAEAEEEEEAVTVTVYSVPGLTSTTSACECKWKHAVTTSHQSFFSFFLSLNFNATSTYFYCCTLAHSTRPHSCVNYGATAFTHIHTKLAFCVHQDVLKEKLTDVCAAHQMQQCTAMKSKKRKEKNRLKTTTKGTIKERHTDC